MSELFLGDAEMMARTFGIVLGAASCSEHVSNERLDVTAGKMKSALAAAASNGRVAGNRLPAVIGVGHRRPPCGAARCHEDWAAETALRQIENDLDHAELVLD